MDARGRAEWRGGWGEPADGQEVLPDRGQVTATPGTPGLGQLGPRSSPRPPPALSPDSGSAPTAAEWGPPPTPQPHCASPWLHPPQYSVQVGPNFPGTEQGCRGPARGPDDPGCRGLRGVGGAGGAGCQAVGSEPRRCPCGPRPLSPRLAEPRVETRSESLRQPPGWPAKPLCEPRAPWDDGDDDVSLRGLSQLPAVMGRHRFGTSRN